MLTWIEVNITSLRHNLETFAKLLPHHTIIPVIKSNAYGASQTTILETLKTYVDTISVVSTTEALRLRKNLSTHKLIVLSIIDPADIEECIKQGIELPLYNDYYLNLIAKSAKKLDKSALVHLKIDAGTHRLGYTLNQLDQVLVSLKIHPEIQVVGIFSHFAASEELPNFTKEQKTLFEQAVQKTKTILGDDPRLIHMACSAAILSGAIPKSSNAIRLGLALYGYWPSDVTKELARKNVLLEPILTWKTKIIHLNQYEAGQHIGYGCTYTLDKPSTIATLPIGYYDGYARSLGNQTEVLIHGVYCPVRGRICMNLMMVDVTNIENVEVGDEVVILGKQLQEEITAEELASHAGTINYEIVDRINSEIPRIVVG